MELILFIFLCIVIFSIYCDFYPLIEVNKKSKKTKQVKSLKKHKVTVLIYNREHLEKAKRLLEKYGEERSWLFPIYSKKTYIAFYNGEWYTYPFKFKKVTSVTLAELEKILKNQ